MFISRCIYIYIYSKLGFTQPAEKMVFQRFCPAHVNPRFCTATRSSNPRDPWKCPLRTDLSWQQFQFKHCLRKVNITTTTLPMAWQVHEVTVRGVWSFCHVRFHSLDAAEHTFQNIIRLKIHGFQFRTLHWTFLQGWLWHTQCAVHTYELRSQLHKLN
jgi:hypothetical protein